MTYNETWGGNDIHWIISKDSVGNMNIRFYGTSPFDGSYVSPCDLIRFIGGKAYLNINDAMKYVGESPSSFGISGDGWLMLPIPSGFNVSNLDFIAFFNLYVSTLRNSFEGMAFDDNGSTFSREITAGEAFTLLKAAEKAMDETWDPPIKNMIAGIKWKDYEKKLLSDREAEFIKALESAGVATWQAKLLLSGAKAVNKSLILSIYDTYFADVKPLEDRTMRISSSGMQIYIGSSGYGTVEIDSGAVYSVRFVLTNPDGAKALRELTITEFSGVVQTPDKLIDFSAFGPLVQDVLGQ